MPYLDPSEDKPWLTPDVISFLESIVTPESVVLETGCGGSTVWFAERAKYVLSFETDSVWFMKVFDILSDREISNVVMVRRDTAELGPFVKEYSFDVALIDGRGRVRSVIDALPHLKPGGWLILDDSQRERYAEAHRVMDEVYSCKILFRDGPDETTAWRVK